MWHHVATACVSAMRKSSDSDSPETPTIGSYKLPLLGWVIVALLTLVVLPAFVWVSYSLKRVYVTLAIVEDPKPSSYEAVPSYETDDVPAAAPGAGAAADEAEPAGPVTASIRRTYRLLRSVDGVRGNFRGLLLAMLIGLTTHIGGAAIGTIPYVFPLLGNLIMMLVLVQLEAAWVHTVIRATRSHVSVFRGGLRALPLRRTFEATAAPVFLAWLAQAITTSVSLGLAYVLKMAPPEGSWSGGNDSDGGDDAGDGDLPVGSKPTPDMLWKVVVLLVVAVALDIFLTMPANVVLVRVQASLLPPDEDTLVPVDRSFGGAVEPAVVDPRGYVTLRDAFRTFSPASWRRVACLYVKIFAMSIGLGLAYVVGILLVIFLLATNPDK